MVKTELDKERIWHITEALKILPNASKMVRDGRRIDTSFSWHYYSFTKCGWERRPGEVYEVALGFPSLEVWDLVGLGCWSGLGGSRPGVGPAGLWVHALSRVSIYIPRKIGIGVALRTRHMGVLKFSGTVLVAWRGKESQVTWRLVVQFKIC